MEKISLLILHDDKNKEYSLALSVAISNLHNELDVTLTSCKETPIEKFDIVAVIGDNMGLNLTKHQCIVTWTEKIPSPVQKEQVVTEIYKYTSVREIVSILKVTYSIFTGKTNLVSNLDYGKNVGFYSTNGRTGKTVCAITTARCLSYYHDKTVLYINLEPWNSAACYMRGNKPAKTIGDFLYYLFHKEKQHVAGFMEEFLYQDEYGVETFMPSLGFNELTVFSYEEYFHFFKKINIFRKYDFIILDLPTVNGDHPLLPMCDMLVVVEQDEAINRIMTNQFIHYMKEKMSYFDEEKVIFVKNFGSDEGEREEEMVQHGSLHKRQIYIDRDEASFHKSKDGKEVELEGIFGIGVEKVAKHILK